MCLCVRVCVLAVSVVIETVLPAWPLQGRGYHQLCQPVKCAFLHSTGYMECKTLEKCVWNIRVTCLKWQWGSGLGGIKALLKREDPWQGILFEGIVTHSSGQGSFQWPDGSPSSGQNTIGMEGHMLSTGSNEAELSGFCGVPFWWREEKANLLLSCSPMGPQISHKNSLACLFQGFCLSLMIRSVDPVGLNG